MSIAKLKEDVWKDYPQVEDSTIRGYISELRQELRKALLLPDTYDPLPSADKQAYKLDLR